MLGTIVVIILLQQVRSVCVPARILSAVCTALGWHHSMELLDCISTFVDLEGAGYYWSNCGKLYLVAQPQLQVAVFCVFVSSLHSKLTCACVF